MPPSRLFPRPAMAARKRPAFAANALGGAATTAVTPVAAKRGRPEGTGADAAEAAAEVPPLSTPTPTQPASCALLAAGQAGDDTVDLSFAKLDGKPLKFVKRLMGEAKRLLSARGLAEAKKGGYQFDLLDRDNLSKWSVKLRDLNPEGRLAKDLARHDLEPCVDLELSLPDGFPLEPPFARVVYPQLAGGYVFSRGGICFEPLTAKGWAPSMTLSALAVAVKGILDYGEVRVAGVGDRAARVVAHYTEEGARKDHASIVAAHRGGEGATYGALKNYAS